jgi:hypothetical protein
MTIIRKTILATIPFEFKKPVFVVFTCDALEKESIVFDIESLIEAPVAAALSNEVEALDGGGLFILNIY